MVNQPEWKPYRVDPIADATGVSFDRTPQGKIKAPPGRFRVCAYHIDFDEAPTVYADAATLDEAKDICVHLSERRGDWNVDFAMVYDEHAVIVHSGRPW